MVLAREQVEIGVKWFPAHVQSGDLSAADHRGRFRRHVGNNVVHCACASVGSLARNSYA